MIDTQPLQTRHFSARDSLEGAIGWWREAGVDNDFADAPGSWLAQPETGDAVAARPPPPPAQPAAQTPLQRALTPGRTPTIGGDRNGWPDTLEEFREWWMTEPSLDDGALERRIPPRGVAGAKLMILVGQPEADDAGGVLTGQAGGMLGSMLRAMAIEPHQAYLASALPTPRAMPQWDALGAAGLGDVVRHHIALAAPERLLAIGRSQLAMFAVDPALAREPLTLACGGKDVPLLAAPDLAELARSAVRRRNYWQRWLDWTR